MSKRSALAVADLFDEPNKHDPGGKVATKLASGIEGSAEFYGDRWQYRTWLARWWDGGALAPYILWIGMNPSTATAEVNDPTITREIGFTKAFGFRHYRKVNICDYRATKPADMLAPGVQPRSNANLPTILHYALTADRIIVCHGVLHPKLDHYADETVNELRMAGHRLYCLGKTLMGRPRHPLYLKSDTQMEPY